jgi:tRNA U34 2-thiouridine synthase MnmA/TrmU
MNADEQRGMKRGRALGLLSGGLDSILACRMMLEQGIEVIAVNFTSPFCTCTRKGCRHQASKAAEELGIQLKLLPTGQEYIEMVKHPKHGRGSHMNPCIDCRIFTFSRARAYADEIGADFVFSGEVLGERPMSQHLRALKLIEKESGLEGRLLRPLSAQLLEPTIPERQGLVNREKLLTVQGRSRKVQIQMAEDYGMNDYPCPAGGCLLTDAQFSVRLRDAFEHSEALVRDMQFLKVGRHFRLPGGAKVIVGRNEAENQMLCALVQPPELSLEAQDFVGPIVILRRLLAASLKDDADKATAARICARYCDGKSSGTVKIKAGADVMEVEPASEGELAALRIGA